jgi:hypothetical protein
MKHLSSLQLCAFLDDVLVGAPDDQTARHLALCEICRTRYEAWCHVDDSLRELLGLDPDEHAMEQRMAWVEIAVAAERKGLPAPEFAELRIPLPPPAPASPPVQLFPPGRGPVPGAASRMVPPRTAVRGGQAPPPIMAPPPAGPAPGPSSRTGAPATPREPIRRPVLHVPLPPPPARAPRETGPGKPAPAPAAPRLPARETAALAASRATHGAAETAADPARQAGYARMPRPARRGFAAFVSRPAVWLTFAVVAALATALPLGVARFGMPQITFGVRPPHAQDADVKKAAADATTDRQQETEPSRPRKPAPHESAAPGDPSTQPDASVLFDLPALEPEDGEPDPGEATPAPKRSTPAADRGSEGRGASMICGEVRSAQGTPIEGARVTLAAPTRTVRTDRQGHFCIPCPPGKRTLRIEAAGRATVTRTVQLGRDRLETRFTLDVSN